MPEITVYGKPGCQGCRLTTRRLAHHGLPHRYVDVTEDADAAREVAALGYMSLPVVTVGDVHWSGFRLNKLDWLAEIHASAPDLVGLDAAAVTYLTEEE
ncbi:glutaredoxin family protein [Nocardia thailandica]|uniref:glutaredoxin family protein n=1 Tax=Nocardia thailandica TaxID=257275 RepID=UPI00030BB7EF|nr:glutaredoxin family protein [Nocardia thailandica]